jgi:hypothetical protein
MEVGEEEVGKGAIKIQGVAKGPRNTKPQQIYYISYKDF